MLLLHLLAVMAVTAAALLGLWQLDAWQTHREHRAADLADADPVALDSVMAADDPFPADGAGRPVRFSGRWLPDDSVYVERSMSGRSGYWVVTPVATCADGADCPAILVVRGWSPSHPVGAPAGSRTVEVTGWLQPGESAAGEPAETGTDVVASLRVADVLQRMDRDLYGGYVIARSPADPALQPVTPESLPDPPRFTAVRNLLYALEWWVFGLFAAFLWLRWCRDEVAVEVAAAAAGGPEGASEEDAEPASDRPVPSAP
jgi:cytochrome oxidase assembly protein ShyY1